MARHVPNDPFPRRLAREKGRTPSERRYRDPSGDRRPIQDHEKDLPSVSARTAYRCAQIVRAFAPHRQGLEWERDGVRFSVSEIKIDRADWDGWLSVGVVATDLRTGEPLPVNNPYLWNYPELEIPDGTWRKTVSMDGTETEVPNLIEDPLTAMQDHIEQVVISVAQMNGWSL